MMKNDSGLLSLDFIVGFTVFLAAFIVVIGMLPGVYVNIQSSSADSGRDMTAYRTGVILAEDSGISSDGIPWEQQPPMYVVRNEAVRDPSEYPLARKD